MIGLYSKNGNFNTVDSIGTPHPYCITPKHVEIASDHFCGRLGEEAILAAEKKGARCGVKGCNLSFKEHEKALLISCKKPFQENGKVDGELHEFLLGIKDEATKNGFARFAFKEDLCLL
jgi:hypothetical protein